MKRFQFLFLSVLGLTMLSAGKNAVAYEIGCSVDRAKALFLNSLKNPGIKDTVSSLKVRAIRESRLVDSNYILFYTYHIEMADAKPMDVVGMITYNKDCEQVDHKGSAVDGMNLQQEAQTTTLSNPGSAYAGMPGTAAPATVTPTAPVAVSVTPPVSAPVAPPARSVSQPQVYGPAAPQVYGPAPVPRNRR